MAESNALEVAITATDVVQKFIRSYDNTISSLKPHSKSKKLYPTSYKSIEQINITLDVLLEVIKANRISELPHYMVYNILLLAALDIKYFEKGYPNLGVKTLMDSLKAKHQSLFNLSEIQARLVRSK